jgi:hypothetical protein
VQDATLLDEYSPPSPSTSIRPSGKQRRTMSASARVLPGYVQHLGIVVRLALSRFGSEATNEEMFTWIKHQFGRKYDIRQFEASLARVRSQRDARQSAA